MAAQRALALTYEGALVEQRFEAARAVGTILVSRGRILESEQLFEGFEDLVSRLSTPGRAASALWLLGAASQLAGRCEESHLRLSRNRALIEERLADLTGTLWGGAAPQVSNLLWLERTQMYTGRLEQGFQSAEQALTLARLTDHPPTLTWAMVAMVNWLFMLERWQEGQDLAQEAAEISQRYQIKPRIGASRIIQGRALVASGRVAEGATLMRSGVDLWLEASSILTATLMVTAPASAMAAVGDLQAVQDYLDIGERLMGSSEERLGQAELLRLRGWVCRHNGDVAGARAELARALAVSRWQGSRLFELRAALDLVKLNEGGEFGASALAELKRAYGGFTEGFDFPLLIGARKILESKGMQAS